MGKLTVFTKFLIALAVVAVVVFAVRYFKKDGKNEATSSGSKSITSIFKGEDDNTLVIGLNTWCGFSGLVYMNNGTTPNEDCRLFKEFGIKADIRIIDIFADSRNAFKKGELDAVYCTADVLPIEMGSQSDMVNLKTKMIFQIDWSRGGDAIVVTKGIKTVADLKGKTIAVAEGTASHTLLIKVLETNGLLPTDVVMNKVEDGIKAAEAFKAGAVDAAVVWSPDDADCVDAISGSKVLISTKTATHIIADGLLVTEETLNKKKELLDKLVSAWLVGNATLNTSSDAKSQAAVAFAKSFLKGSENDIKFAELGISNVRFSTLNDNKDFFGLNSSYEGVTGDKLYTKMSRVYSDIKLAQNPLPWRSISNTSVIESVTLNTPEQASETSVKFAPVTEDIKKKEAISNKKVSINFATNSSDLDDEAKAIIDKEFVDIAKSFTNARIRIEGNTDNTGMASYNKALSMKRAQSVANYLVKEYGFDANRFDIRGNGSAKAIEAGDKGDNEFYRRTDFQLVAQ